MESTNRKAQIKAIPIVDYLASLGVTPERQQGKELVYYSPIREERTPSFYVNPGKNLYKDYGKDGGDIIKLVMELNNISYQAAIEILNRWVPSDKVACRPTIFKENSKIKGEIQILSVREIRHQALINYLLSRRIPFSFAENYLKEVHYQNGDKRFFSLGFKNDNGGWALRNERFKNCIGSQGITYFPVSGNRHISIFEGFFDFLSALVYNNVYQSSNSVLVLNSTSNLKAAIPIIEKYQSVHTYFDRDQAGQNAFLAIERLRMDITDKSLLYSGFNDFSEFLCRKTEY